MMQGHRHWHLGLWLVLAPVLAATLWLALASRPSAPVNDALPGALASPAAESTDE